MSEEANCWFSYKDEKGKTVSIHIPNLYDKVEELKKQINRNRNQIQGLHNKQVGHIDIEHKEIINKEISELTKIVYDLIQDLHIGVLNSSGSWSLLLDRLKKLGDEKVHSASHTEKCPICNGTGINIHRERDHWAAWKDVSYPCQCKEEEE